MSGLGEVLQAARRARGMTQEDLASAAGVTQAALSRYENDMREPSKEVLEQLARALGVTSAFLAHAGRIKGGMAIDAHMRRRMTAKPTVWRRLESRLNMCRIHASLLFEEVSLHTETSIPALDVEEALPSDAARITRMQWRMPVGPVHRLTAWLEAAGCLVIEEDFGTTRVDGLSQWVDDHPVMLINSRLPVDRKRLTLAHELGHLVLHSEVMSIDVENEANEFASEFLMPLEVVRPQLQNLTIGRMHDLKREWGVSMQALIERAYGIGAISGPERTKLYKIFSARGWRTHEPVSEELPPDNPTLPAKIADAYSRRGYSPDDVARVAGFSSAYGNDIFRSQVTRLRAV